jgi:UDP-N-acetylmuramoylalanine--D-glutamate ligase
VSDDLQALLARPALVVGLGITGRAVARALARRGHVVLLVDDRPGDPARALAAELAVELHERPDGDRLAALAKQAGVLVPAPGLPESHAVFAAAAAAGVPVVSELDLAALWDDRPCVAITGTDGKTTVTTLVTAMLEASGLHAIDAGNTDVPLVTAIDDPTVQVFVVEASSFRLTAVRDFRPRVGTWLNWAPDHLDVHRDLAGYEAAKARLWSTLTRDEVAVANADDPVVMSHTPGVPRVETFGLGRADWHVADGELRGPDGTTLVAVDELFRSFPHDVSNALAAAATALGVGATLDGVRSTLRNFRGLPHRVALVGEAGGVRWYDDSKATAPHATLAAVRGFDSVVLIAGGHNKGLDLGELAAAADRLRAVVAIGDAAADVEAAFDDVVPVRRATSMDRAVAAAAELARPGDAVLLSPGCASFDWYRSYGERGDDFVRAVTELLGHPA